MNGKNVVKICWLRNKYNGKYVCFIPLTIDGMGRTIDDALDKLEIEACKIISAVKRAKIKCGFSTDMIHKSIARVKKNYVEDINGETNRAKVKGKNSKSKRVRR